MAETKDPAAPATAEATPDPNARFTAEGIDLSAMDPTELKEAIDFARSAKGRKLVDAGEFENAVTNRVRELANHPDFKAHFQAQYGFVDPASSPAGDDDAPVTKAEMRRIEQAQLAMAQAIAGLNQETNTARSQRIAREKAEGILQTFSDAVRSVPGADEHPNLMRLFRAAIADKDLAEDATPAQVKRWIQAETKTIDNAVSKRAARVKAPRTDEDVEVTVGRAAAKGKSKSWAEAVQDIIEAQGLQ